MNLMQKHADTATLATTQNGSTAQHHNSQTPAIGGVGTQTPPAAPPVPPASPTPYAHAFAQKNSLRGTNLARRARSFKDDILSLMRPSSNSTFGRAHSPHSPRSKYGGLFGTKTPTMGEELARSTQTLNTHVRDICNALKHFRDVVSKRKLEVLPGNGTVILETIASMYAVIQSYTLNEQSTLLLSATQQVYLSLAKLIKLCDEVLLTDELHEMADSASLSENNVREVVELLEDAVRNLVALTQQKLSEREDAAFQFAETKLSLCPTITSTRPPAKLIENADELLLIGDGSGHQHQHQLQQQQQQHHLMRPPAAEAGQRTSLPDIALTNQERDSILEKSNANPIRASHSTESILRDTSPPPKPPLPHRSSNPPPLPPKRRIVGNQRQQQQPPQTPQSRGSQSISINSDMDCNSDFPYMNYAIDRLSVRSRSPDENSSQCSIDSALNYSRGDDEEHKLLRSEHAAVSNHYQKQMQLQHNLEDFERIYSGFSSGSFVSMKSFRTSTQSVSKRSSDNSFQSSTKSSNSNWNMAADGIGAGSGIHETNESPQAEAAEAVQVIGGDSPDLLKNHKQQQQQQHDESLLSISPSPPALPPKTAVMLRSSTRNTGERQQSLCDNTTFDELDEGFNNVHEFTELRQHAHCATATATTLYFQQESSASFATYHQQYQHQEHFHWLQNTKHQSLIDQRLASPSCATISGYCTELERNLEMPPPLPVKKKHILAYMEICSASTRSIEQHRHTMHAYNLGRNITHSQTMSAMPVSKELHTTTEDEEQQPQSLAALTSPSPSPSASSSPAPTPPALPPKNYKPRKTAPTIITTPPASPKAYAADAYCDENGLGGHSARRTEIMSTLNEEVNDNNNTSKTPKVVESTLSAAVDDTAEPRDTLEAQKNGNVASTEEPPSGYNKPARNDLPQLLEEIDITPYLVYKKTSDDGPEVKGGYINALIVHASRVQKVTDNAFCEAFITTFRTFIAPIEVIERLIHRYTVFFCQLNEQKQKAAKETFSLLVRVVNDLTSTDMTSQLLKLLVNFVYQLVSSGQLYLAKLLRNKFVEKVTLYKEQKVPVYPPLPDMYVTVVNQPTLLDLKSAEIAEQMTLLDAELFQKIEIPEVLLFAKDQCEEKSPNLNKFTEHFNKTSYWARTKILMLSDAKEREKHVIKFIKIMKHLRKMNNYNSYLALLSALDSAPIRRLEWHKTITEGLKEYCTLIDSSSSFRVYRLALAETNPPCIPYIGLVLQDLTFVHVGNQDYLRDGVINFSKRWQQYNIIFNMKRFKKCSYPFRRNERIIRFFENFDNFLGEEEMWQISESIKPRGRGRT